MRVAVVQEDLFFEGADSRMTGLLVSLVHVHLPVDLNQVDVSQSRVLCLVEDEDKLRAHTTLCFQSTNLHEQIQCETKKNPPAVF